ncbi:MAG: cysteine hydrolase family protein [Candidatus Nanoarchaeia archaeon]
MKTAIYETDVQYDFALREGALFVYGNKPKTALPYGAEASLPNIYHIHAKANKENYLILGSVDRHFYEDAELIRNKGGVFQDHCMNGTWGQLRLKELEPQKDIYIRAKDGPQLGIKNYTQEELEKYIQAAEKEKMHLIFEKQSYDVGTNPNFETAFKMLLEGGLEKIIVNGFATDYCDKAAVLKIADIKNKYSKNLQIYVVTDAIEAVNINFQGQVDNEFGNKAIEEMVAAGAKLVTTKDVLEGKI